MRICEIRHKQWEIADAISSYLNERRVLAGRVNEIIRICNIQSDGQFVGKFLQRSESMAHSPFIIRRIFEKDNPNHTITYHIRLKATD